MSEPRRHHYVPQFLLSEWQGPPDGLLTRFMRGHGSALVDKRIGAKGVAFEIDLYAFAMPSGAKDVSVERDFFGPYVDEPAALVHKAMIAVGIKSLTADQRGYWAQFLVAAYMRVPRTMKLIDAMSREQLGGTLDSKPGAFREAGHTALDTREFIDQHYPKVYDRVTREGMPKFIQQARLIDEMTKGRWSIRTLSPRCRFTFLIGDHPLIKVGDLRFKFMVALPLTPRAMFLYADPETERSLFRLTDETFAKARNQDTVRFASRYVIGLDASQRTFVERRLREIPDV